MQAQQKTEYKDSYYLTAGRCSLHKVRGSHCHIWTIHSPGCRVHFVLGTGQGRRSGETHETAITDNKKWQNLLIYMGQSLEHQGVFLGSVRVNRVLLKGATSTIRKKTSLYCM